MTPALRIVLVLFVISLAAGAITGTPLYYRLSYVWGFILLGSWGMSKMALRNIDSRRRARTYRSQVGQIFEERFEVINSTPIPRLWIEVRDESTLPGTRGSHIITMIGGRRTHSYLARKRLTSRGVFSLGPTVLVSGDIFGMFPVKRVFTSKNHLLVYPMIVEIYSFPNPPGLLPGGEALRRRTPHITSNASGIREYEPGDPFNRIHWVSTARRNKLMSKEFELDPLAEVWIIVDADQNVNFSQPQPANEFTHQDLWQRNYEFKIPPASIEYSVTIAASLARFYMHRKRSVGVITSGSSIRVLPADRGSRQLNKILEALAIVQPDGNLPLQGLVEVQLRYLQRGSTIVLITPNATQTVYQTVDMINRHGLRPMVILINPSSFGRAADPGQLQLKLQSAGVPAYQINQGDEISKVLSNAVNMVAWY